MPAGDGAGDPAGAVAETVTTVWRRESPRLIAALVRMTSDITLAEDLAQDALVAALEQWPSAGVPDNPGAWLMAVSKRRAVDAFRRAERERARAERLGHAMAQDAGEEVAVPDFDAVVDFIEDDQLRLMFVSCHPVLPVHSRVALTLRLLGGLTTNEVARALLADERAVAQRIVRAKRTIAAAGVPFEVPTGTERAERLSVVLEVVYLMFTEGYAATAGDDWTRPALCSEALRLSRLLADLAPAEPEAHGLLALLHLQASRLPARTGPAGAPVLLGDQDRTLWDSGHIERGLTALTDARRLTGAAASGTYTVQAEIAACHARATSVATTDWHRIASLYDQLASVAASPVVEVNRAVAHGRAHGPAVGLAVLDAVRDDPALRGYHLLHSVRADLLQRLGRHAEANDELGRAAALARNRQERALLEGRRNEARSDPTDNTKAEGPPSVAQ